MNSQKPLTDREKSRMEDLATRENNMMSPLLRAELESLQRRADTHPEKSQ